MNITQSINAFLGTSLLCLAVANAQANPFVDKDKPFDEYSWVTTHNSYEKINQNLAEMPRQLRDGVRGFMLDLYTDEKQRGANRIKVCHKGEPFCYGPLASQLKNEFLPFLNSNPSEVVTIFLETYVSRDDLQAVFNTLPDLGKYTFNPKNFGNERWPTIKEMAQKNNRLILLTDKSEISGSYHAGNQTITVLYDQDWIVQNHWDTLGPIASSIEKTHNWSCPTRWDGLPLTTEKVHSSTGKQWNRLFLMNQFHTATSTIPDSASYDNNLTYLTRRADNCGRAPNFIGLNHYQAGDTMSYTKALSQGGLYFWEGGNADKKQDAVCVLPRGSRTLSLPSQGCENDEIRSMSLSGIDKGTRITVFDNAGGSRADDYAIIDVKRDIGIHERVVLGSFEQDLSNSTYNISYGRNNGLNGKISRIEVSVTPTDFSDAGIAFYEGNNATQNLDCTVPFNSIQSFGMKSGRHGCSNDEIRSAKIMKAKMGTSFTVRGHPNGNNSQGVSVVTIKRDINFPIVIGSFDSSYENADVKVAKSGKALDGKISHGAFNGAR